MIVFRRIRICDAEILNLAFLDELLTHFEEFASGTTIEQLETVSPVKQRKPWPLEWLGHHFPLESVSFSVNHFSI